MSRQSRAYDEWLDDLASRETEAVAWLKRAGPIAKRMNEEAKLDQGDNQ